LAFRKTSSLKISEGNFELGDWPQWETRPKKRTAVIKVFIHKSIWKRDITCHYGFSEKQSRVDVTHQSFGTRFTPEHLLFTHDIYSTSATFSSLDNR